MIKNYSNRNYIKSVKSWGAEGPSPKNNNNLGSILLGAAIGVVIAGFSFYKINQKRINLLRINLADANNRNNTMQREMDMLAEENLAATAVKETVEEKIDEEL
jgi:uncharacterized protein HemX